MYLFKNTLNLCLAKVRIRIQPRVLNPGGAGAGGKEIHAGRVSHH